ncbi:MAG: DUF1932 domain-containing protein [Pseudomonadota bacterium]
MRIALLHPGEMGVSVGQTLRASGHEVCWLPEGRSAATFERAQDWVSLGGMADLREFNAVIAICPPAAALVQAEAVVEAGFAGIYVDANAVAPVTAAAIARVVGDRYVDGGIIGPPSLKPGTTRLYLSGELAEQVAGWFTAGPLEAISIGAGATRASMLKMTYAAYTKGISALLLAVNALAAAGGVRDELYQEWALSQPGLRDRSDKAANGTSRKAWRFEGEMREIATTFADADLPSQFHEGAGDLYAAMAALKELPHATLEQVIEEILKAR